MNDSLRVACIGGADTDTRLRVRAPIQMKTSNPADVAVTVGGVACNVARTLGNLGIDVGFFGPVGDDEAGAQVAASLRGAGVDVAGLEVVPGAATARYTAVVDVNGALVVGLAAMDVHESMDEEWAETLAPILSRFPVWVLDTNVPAESLELLLEEGEDPLVLVDPVSAPKAAALLGRLDAVDALFPDRREATVLSGIEVVDMASAGVAASALRDRGVREVVVTMGREGVCAANRSGITVSPAIPEDHLVDATGAGDAFVAGYAFGVATSQPDEAVTYGIAAASLAVETAGSVPELDRDALYRRAAREAGQ